MLGKPVVQLILLGVQALYVLDVGIRGNHEALEVGTFGHGVSLEGRVEG